MNRIPRSHSRGGCLHGRLAVTLLILAALWGENSVFAQSAQISAEIAGSSPPVRSGAPITIVWKLRSQSNSLVQGRLELVVVDGTDRLARLVTDELVLTTGEQLFRTVLPSLDSPNPIAAVELRLRFVGPKQTVDLGEHTLRLFSPWQRNFVVAICDPWQTNLNPAKQALLQQFRFETYNADNSDRTITTSMAHIRPDEMASDPLAYCGFDVVLLVHEGFANSKDAQLQAILAWVDAGGSLCVVPGRQVLSEHHVKFLNGLTAPGSAGVFLLDGGGRLMMPSDEPPIDPQQADAGEPAEKRSTTVGHLMLKRWGLGRVAVLLGELEAPENPSEVDLRRMMAFLWKLRQDRVSEFVSTGKWRPVKAAAPSVSDPNQTDPRLVSQDSYAQMRPQDMQLAPVALQTGDQLLTWLMPRNLHVVPLGFVGLVLMVYVLVIGPGDYFLLGALKRRRLTWVLFPAVTVGFAVGTVTFSNWYMRVSDNRRSVTFLDVGETGRIARRNRFEVLFRGTPAEVSTDVTRGLLTAMNHQRFSQGSWYNYQQAMRRGDENQLDLVAIPVYEGRVPALYAVTQYLPQWTPQLNRLFTLPVADEASQIDWQSLASAGSAGPSAKSGAVIDRQKITHAVRNAFGAEASAYVATGESVQHVTGKAGILQQDDPQYSAGYGNQPNYYPVNAHQSRNTTFLQDACSPWTSGGLFSIVSQTAPTGGKDFEDLALFDPSDPRQWLLIVIVERGDDLFVYRKLYHGEP